MAVDLRPYQLRAVERARQLIRDGKRRILICAPTGSGKTVMGSHLIDECSAKGNRSMFLVDRISLIEQTSETFERYGIDHGVIQGQHWRFHPERLTQVCSVQTLQRRRLPDAKLVLIDEAHGLNALTRAMLTSGTAIYIGLSATPFTRSLGLFYDAIINVTTTNELIRDGFLVPFRIFSCAEPDMKGVRVVAGEWEEKGASTAALQVVGDVVQEYLKNGQARKFICSAVDTNHVEELARQFLAVGINVATYTYKDRDDDRAETLAEYRRTDSTIRGLITVTAASKGFDCPDIGCVIMARPLRSSLAEFIQFLGRGLRISPDTGKVDCLVLDHSGNCARFWSEFQHFFENGWDQLDMGTKAEQPKPEERAEPEPIKCPVCGHLHKPRPVCPQCGHEYPKKSAVEHVPGTLKELLAGGNQATITREVWPQVCAYARQKRPGDEVAAKKMALALYRDLANAWPGRDFERTKDAPITPEVASKIRSVQIRFQKRRDKAKRQAVAA